MIKESINLNSVVTVDVDGVQRAVLNMYSTINVEQCITTMTMEVIDKALFDANKTYVLEQKAVFMTALNAKLEQNGLILI